MQNLRYQKADVDGLTIFYRDAGAEAFTRDIPDADVRFFDTGHFAVETHGDQIAAAMRGFLDCASRASAARTFSYGT